MLVPVLVLGLKGCVAYSSAQVVKRAWHTHRNRRPSSLLAVKQRSQKVVIVTTAAIPWRTGEDLQRPFSAVCAISSNRNRHSCRYSRRIYIEHINHQWPAQLPLPLQSAASGESCCTAQRLTVVTMLCRHCCKPRPSCCTLGSAHTV